MNGAGITRDCLTDRLAPPAIVAFIHELSLGESIAADAMAAGHLFVLFEWWREGSSPSPSAKEGD
jgi:hypothetical protein